jgi:hypothetical protein
MFANPLDTCWKLLHALNTTERDRGLTTSKPEQVYIDTDDESQQNVVGIPIL